MIVTTMNGLHFKVSEAEAHKIDDLITGANPPAFIEIDGNTIAVNTISGLIEDSVWYEKHPDKRPQPTKNYVPLLKAPAKIADGPGYRHFLEMRAKFKSKQQ